MEPILNFYKHHIGDYACATAHLTWDEDIAYTRLLRLYYASERPIPREPGETYRLVRAVSKVHKEAVTRVLHEFFVEREDGWHQKRADEELTAYRRQCDVNRELGKRGGRPSKSESVSENNRIGSVHETEPKPNHNPNQKPESINQNQSRDIRELISSTALLLKRPVRKFE